MKESRIFASKYRTFAELIISCRHFGNIPLFIPEKGIPVSFCEFADIVFSLAKQMVDIPEQFIIISSSDPVIYSESYLASVISGHTACLDKPGEKVSACYRGLSDCRRFSDLHLSNGISSVELSELPYISSDALCTIVPSSGTSSGTCRLVGLSQNAILENTAASIELYRYKPKTKCVHILPYWHMFAIISELFSPLFSGASVCLPCSLQTFFSSLRRFCPDFLQMTPAVADVLASMITEYGLSDTVGSNLKKILISGATLDWSVCKTLSRSGISVCTAYGLTECSPCVTIMPDDDIHPGTSGKALSCLDIRCAADGEILVRGACLMLGYVSDSGKIESPLSDGWLHTGDIGKIDDSGFLTVLGRKNNVIVLSNGQKIIPEQIEYEINKIPGVTESLLCLAGHGAEEIPILTIVYDSMIPDSDKINSVMCDSGISVYRRKDQHTKLKRNEMGKIQR